MSEFPLLYRTGYQITHGILLSIFGPAQVIAGCLLAAI